jgi:LysM repeat protein
VEKLLDFLGQSSIFINKMMKKFPLTLFLLATIVLAGFLGIYFLNNPSSQPCQDKQRLCVSGDNLYMDQVKRVAESPELTFIQKNSLAGISCSQIFSSKVLGALAEGEVPDESGEITEYVVQSGDSLGSIATNFDISLNTILWANDLTRSSVIRPGQKLVILPTSGIIHHVGKGNTLSGIAETYKGEVDEIIAFNDISEEGDIYVGDILIVPDGVQPPPSYPSPTYTQIPVASSYFIYPVSSPFRITQRLHWYNAIDFANKGNSCGKPVFAAAGGEILKVRYGYNQGSGNYVRILHPNGLITHYGHLQKILVIPGQKVSQGEMVGLIGYSGRTIPAGPSGCHLHFGLYSSQGRPPTNPF